MLELDVGVTKDGKVVVSHDTTLDRTTNGHGTIASHTLKQIRKLDAAFWFAKGDDAYSHDRKRSAYKLPRRSPPASASRRRATRARDFRVPTLKQVMKAFPQHADQHRDQGPHAGRGDRRSTSRTPRCSPQLLATTQRGAT